MESMTGFGRGEATAGGKRCLAEVKSLNHRFLEIRCRLPRTHGFFELRVQKLVQSRFNRGRFDVEIRLENDPSLPLVRDPDLERARALVESWSRLKKNLNLSGEISLEFLVSRPEIWSSEPDPAESEADWELIEKTLLLAFSAVQDMRTQEGAVLSRDLETRIQRIENRHREIQGFAGQNLERAREKINRVIQDSLGPAKTPSLERLEQEIAFLAERSDISEELTRLESHLQAFRNSMGNRETGKRLEFLTQEMGRETNTIGAKSSLLEISQRTLEMKLELEKIREQIQNLA